MERGIQRRATAQQSGVPNAAGVRASHCSASVAYGSLRAAMRRTERGTSHEFRRFKRRMIPCAKYWGRSGRIPDVGSVASLIGSAARPPEILVVPCRGNGLVVLVDRSHLDTAIAVPSHGFR